jgi:hypothetical protein
MKIVYLITENGEGTDKKSYWNRVGVAFENRDGSINVKLDFLPGVKLQIREPKGDAGEG